MPGPGQIYRSPTGEPMIYVRTDHQPPNPEQHLYVFARKRSVYEMRLGIDEDLPPEYELVNDTAGRVEAEIYKLEMRHHERERAALIEAMKEAIALLPTQAATTLRNKYQERLCA